MKVLVAGKHELACGLWEGLRRRPELSVGAIVCPGETESVGQGGRASLRAALRTTGEEPVNQSFTHEGLLEAVRGFEPQILLSAGYDRIIRSEVLELVQEPLNVHFGMLPKYRGSYSIPWAILHDEAEIGVTLHRMAPGIDDGPIVLQTTLSNDRARSCRELYLEAVAHGEALVESYLDLRGQGKLPAPRPQDEARATYFPPEYPHAFRIPWRQTARYVYDYVRASHFPPFAPAQTFVNGRAVGVEFPVDVDYEFPGHPPGAIVRRGRCFWIAALNGWIRPGVVSADGARLPFDELVETHSLVEQRCD